MFNIQECPKGTFPLQEGKREPPQCKYNARSRQMQYFSKEIQTASNKSNIKFGTAKIIDYLRINKYNPKIIND